jgi:hypothetical protein
VTPREDARQAWKNELGPTPSCLPFERFGEALTPDEQQHVAACTRCETELALFREFEDPSPAPDEGAAVQWIAAELRRRNSLRSELQTERNWLSWLTLLRPQTLAAAATVLIAVIGIAFVASNREPSLGDVPNTEPDVYRSNAVQVTAPMGDLPAAPTVLHWVAVPGADSYHVRVLEVDRTVLWEADTRQASITMPAQTIARFVPGKTVLWEVSARKADGTPFAQSGTQRFRVTVKPPQGDQP